MGRQEVSAGESGTVDKQQASPAAQRRFWAGRETLTEGESPPQSLPDCWKERCGTEGKEGDDRTREEKREE